MKNKKNAMIVAVLLSMSAVVFASNGPQEVIESSATSVLAEISGGPPVAAAVKTHIMPHVDMKLVAGRIIGPKWRTATEVQKDKLEGLLADYALIVYAGAFKEAQKAKLVVSPAKFVDTENAQVKAVLKGGSLGGPLAMQFSLTKGSAKWILTDVTVEGVSVVSSFRSSFSTVLNNGGIDGLIMELESKLKRGSKT